MGTDWMLCIAMQLEEDLGDDYRWSYRVNQVLFSGSSPFQEIDLVDTPTWGKVGALGTPVEIYCVV